jgi:hypothetical protein
VSSWRVRVRANQTDDEIKRLGTAFDTWLCKRLAADGKKQYQTQLTHLSQLVKNILQNIRLETNKGLPDNTAEAYRFCRQQEKRLLWVEDTLWDFYKEKFDQRDKEGSKQMLEAADDVVWSCYKEAVELGGLTELPPIPLAYVEPYFSPQALPRDEPPPSYHTSDPILKDFFSRLPIPIVSLPPICVDSPWWLIYLGHEIGHHVQYDLGLVTVFGNELRSIVQKGLKPVEPVGAAQRWWDWSKEIFADLFSVLSVGPGAVWAITELVRTRPAEMLIRQSSYPPPIARLALLARTANDLSLAGSAALEEIHPDEVAGWELNRDYEEQWRQEAILDIELVDLIPKAFLNSTLGERGTLRDLTGWNNLDFSSTGLARLWKNAFQDGELRAQQRSIRAARLITAGALEYWRELVTNAPLDDKLNLQEKGKKLRSLYFEAINENRDETTREEVPQAQVDIDALSTDLTKRLFAAEFSEVTQEI